MFIYLLAKQLELFIVKLFKQVVHELLSGQFEQPEVQFLHDYYYE